MKNYTHFTFFGSKVILYRKFWSTKLDNIRDLWVAATSYLTVQGKRKNANTRFRVGTQQSAGVQSKGITGSYFSLKIG